MICFFFSNNRRRQLSGSSMISNFGGGGGTASLGGSNNNSHSQGSESPLPSPRFTRYIRTPQNSDTNSTGGVSNSDNSRPSSATSSSTYSPRLGKICSQPPSVHIGKKYKFEFCHQMILPIFLSADSFTFVFQGGL